MPVHIIPESDGDRFQPERARYVEPTELTWRMKLMARLMVRGCTDETFLNCVERSEYRREPGAKKGARFALPPPAPGEPLEPEEAGILAGLRRRHARVLVDYPIFKRALAEERKLFKATQ